MTKKQTKSSEIIDWFPINVAARHAGLTVDMVNYLCRNGLVKPTGCTKRGRGCVRKYTFSDILLLRVISELLSKGVSVLGLKKSFVSLQKRHGAATKDILNKKYLATDGKDIYLQDKGVLELLTSGQLTFAFVLELDNVRNELAQKMTHQIKRASR